MPFGVELPENLGAAQDQGDAGGGGDTAPDPKPSPTGGDGPIPVKDLTKANQPETPKDILDLDKLERFRFAGREWKPKDLHNAYLMREDYTRKTQEVAEARKYAENFHADLQTVIRNPAMMEKLRAVYPEQYSAIAEKILQQLKPQGQPPQSGQAPQADTANLPPELAAKLTSLEEKFSVLEREKHQAQVAKDHEWLNNQFESLSKKYPSAEPEVILARLEIIERNGTKIDEKLLNKLFNEHDKSVNERWEKRYKEKVDTQLKAGFKAKDVGQGGGIPSGQPRNFKNIKDATAGFLADINAK